MNKKPFIRKDTEKCEARLRKTYRTKWGVERKSTNQEELL